MAGRFVDTQSRINYNTKLHEQNMFLETDESPENQFFDIYVLQCE